MISRTFGLSASMLAASIIFTSFAHAGSTVQYGLSKYGDLKYPQGFEHFEYVNPDAPKAGMLCFPLPWLLIR